MVISVLPAIPKVCENDYDFREGHSTELAALEPIDRIIHDMGQVKHPWMFTCSYQWQLRP